jgi:uncharacterized Zn finger protein (UPF0148 family)
MATTRCPACGLTVPYFCCEGLVCPACGYDAAIDAMPIREAPEEAGGRSSPPQRPASSPRPSSRAGQ